MGKINLESNQAYNDSSPYLNPKDHPYENKRYYPVHLNLSETDNENLSKCRGKISLIDLWRLGVITWINLHLKKDEKTLDKK